MARRKSGPDSGDMDENQDPLFPHSSHPGYNTSPPEQGSFVLDESGNFTGETSFAPSTRKSRKPYIRNRWPKGPKPGPLDQQLPFGSSNLPVPWKSPNADQANPNAGTAIVPDAVFPGGTPVPTGNLPKLRDLPDYITAREIPRDTTAIGDGINPGSGASPSWTPGTELPAGPPQGPRPKPPTNWAQIGNVAAWAFSGRSSQPGFSTESRRLFGTDGMVQRGPRVTNQISIQRNPNAVKLQRQDPLGHMRDSRWAQEGYNPDEHRQFLADRFRSLDPNLTEEQAMQSAIHMEGTDYFKNAMEASQASGIKHDLFKTPEERARQQAASNPMQRFFAGFGGTGNSPSSADQQTTSGGFWKTVKDMNPYRRGNRTDPTGTPRPNPRNNSDYSAMWSGGNPMPGGFGGSAPGGYAGQQARPNQDYTHAGSTSGTGSAWWDIHTQTINQPAFRTPRQQRQPGSPYNN